MLVVKITWPSSGDNRGWNLCLLEEKKAPEKPRESSEARTKLHGLSAHLPDDNFRRSSAFRIPFHGARLPCCAGQFFALVRELFLSGACHRRGSPSSLSGPVYFQLLISKLNDKCVHAWNFTSRGRGALNEESRSAFIAGGNCLAAFFLPPHGSVNGRLIKIICPLIRLREPAMAEIIRPCCRRADLMRRRSLDAPFTSSSRRRQRRLSGAVRQQVDAILCRPCFVINPPPPSTYDSTQSRNLLCRPPTQRLVSVSWQFRATRSPLSARTEKTRNNVSGRWFIDPIEASD